MLTLLPTDSRFPQPDWDTIGTELPDGDLSFEELNAFWTDRGREWVHLLRDACGAGYRGYESAHFWLVSSQPEPTCRQLLAWTEKTRGKIVSLLGEAAGTGETYGKVPILVLHDLETYYEYFARYVSDGEHALTGGVYLNRGYGHFLFTFLDFNQAEAVLAHELTHSLLSPLGLPLWLDEGVAQLCEISVTGRDTAQHDEIRESLGDFWTEDTIQDFWTGRGFSRPDQGQMHSYHLAKVLTRRLTGDQTRFRSFLRDAHAADAGETALQRHFNSSLPRLVAEYLGEGDWAPRLAP